MNTRFSFQLISGIAFALTCFFLVTGSLYISILEQRATPVKIKTQLLITNTPSTVLVVPVTPNRQPLISASTSVTSAIPGTKTSTPRATSTIIKIYFTTTANPTLITISETPEPTQTCRVPTGWVPYIIQPGDTLSYLSHSTGVSLSQMQSANCLNDSNLIRSGQQIFVPYLPPQATQTQIWDPTQTQVWQPTTAPYPPYPNPSETSPESTSEPEYTVTPIYLTPGEPGMPVSSPVSLPTESAYPADTLDAPASTGLP